MLAVNVALLAITLWWLKSRLHLDQERWTALLVSAGAALPLAAPPRQQPQQSPCKNLPCTLCLRRVGERDYLLSRAELEGSSG
jgi:hypothetical protein